MNTRKTNYREFIDEELEKHYKNILLGFLEQEDIEDIESYTTNELLLYLEEDFSIEELNIATEEYLASFSIIYDIGNALELFDYSFNSYEDEELIYWLFEQLIDRLKIRMEEDFRDF